MSKNNLVAYLNLNTQGFEQGVSKAMATTASANKQVKACGDMLDNLTGGLVSGAKKFFAWGAAASAAGKVLKDAFFSSEVAIDAVARMQEQLNAAYDVFVKSISQGSWSNFFENLDGALARAKDLYDTLDALGTMKQTNKTIIAIKENEIARVRQEMAKVKDKNSPEYKKLATALGKLTLELQSLRKDEAELTKKGGFKQIMESMMRYGLNKDEAREATYKLINKGNDYQNEQTNVYNDLRKKAETVTRHEDWRDPSSSRDVVSYDFGKLTPAEQRALRIATAVVRGEEHDLRIQGQDLYASGVNLDTQGYRESEKNLRKTTAATGGGGKTAPVKLSLEEIQFKDPGDRINQAAKQLHKKMQGTVDEMAEIKLPEGKLYVEWHEQLIKLKEEQEHLRMASIESSVMNLANAFDTLGKAIGGTAGDMVSWAAQSALAVAQLLAQNAQLLVSCQAAALAGGAKSAFQLPFPYNLAAYAATAATIVSIFASLPKFASGGIVGGGMYSGDKQLARVNSGEMILNGTQQARLFAMVNGAASASGVGEVKLTITGDQLNGVISNNNRKRALSL